MTARRARKFAALAATLFVTTASASRAEVEHLRFGWSRGAEASSCAEASDIEADVTRRLGFDPANLRLVMNWDDREQDWHALLAVRDDGRTWMLDSILGLQDPRAFTRAWMVYSISEEGIWDHAPDFVPVP